MATALEGRGTRVERFDANTRGLHWVNAAAFAVMAGTGALMFVPSLGDLIGRRELVRYAHEIAGLAAVLWALLALAGPWGSGLRRDLAEIDRLDYADRQWLRGGWRRDLGGRGDGPPVGKFNPGQKLNAVFSAAAMVILAGTGAIMYFHTRFPQWLKSGANLVHDLTAVALTVAVAGHVILALRDRGAMRGMLRGHVSTRWAKQHHAGWTPEQ